MSDNTTLPPDTDTSNPETGSEGKSIPDQVSNVVDLLNAKAKAGESPTAEATSFAKFDQLVELPRRTWFAGRDARYRSLFEAAPMLRAALLDLDQWEAYRKAKAPKSTARTVESQVFDVMVVDDADASVGIKNDAALMSSTTRNVYANAIGWLAFVCLDAEGHIITDADEAVDALKEIGMGKAMLEYISQHPPHFTTKGGRATQGTGRRPGRPRRTATATPATDAVAAVDAKVAEAKTDAHTAWEIARKPDDEPDQATEYDPEICGVRYTVMSSGGTKISCDTEKEARKMVPGVEVIAYRSTSYGILARRREQSDTGLQAGPPPRPVVGPQPPASDQPEFLPASDAAREVPPTVVVTEGETTEGEEAEAEGSMAEVADFLKVTCLEEIAYFVEKATYEQLVMVRDYCRSLRTAAEAGA